MSYTTVHVVSENNHFMVLFKPQGVSVHNQTPSLLEYVKAEKKPEHFVNRLDFETSGLVVIAQNENLHEPLQNSLHKGVKKYSALLRGALAIDEGAKILWNWPISDKAEGRRNPQGDKQNLKAAETEIKLIRKNKYFSQVEIVLKSGRQHQIRKHSAMAKHPIVGDSRYNEEKYNLKIADMYSQKRMQLEAESLEFQFKNEKYKFELKTLELDKFFLK